MIPRKLKVYFAFFPYGGNGGFASEHPAIRNWFPRVCRGLWADERVSEVEWNDFNDTPITMTRNAAVNVARKRGADVLVMVDSDMHPDHALEVQRDPTARPFISSSFDKIYEHWDQGPLVICAPYCGAPLVEENVFVFRWTSRITDNPDRDWRMEQYPRFEAQNKIGFEEVAAAATGLMMVDMRAFQITEPEDESEKPWFYYEYRDKYHDEKVSTEDVTFLRDTSMMGLAKLGYNPVLVNWDAWAGHYKPKCVSKPRVATADKVSRKHARAWAEAVDGEWRDLQVGHGEGPSIAIPQELVQKFLELGGVIPQDRLTAAMQNDRGTGVFTAEQLGVESAATAAALEVKEIPVKHYHPLPSIEESVLTRVKAKTPWVIDFGGNKTHRFVRATQTCGREGQKKVDFDVDKLPYKNGQVNFAYCRHTIEDLGNPRHFLKELQRVAKQGYIETPSPMAELTRGVAGPQVGYAHHRWVVWSEGGVLNLIPKYPMLEPWSWFDYQDQLSDNPYAWNTYHHFRGKLKFKIWEHETDFDINKSQTYREILERACASAEAAARAFVDDAPKSNAKAKVKSTSKPVADKTPSIDIAVIKKLIKDQLGRVDKGTVLCVNAGNDTAVSKAILEAGRKVKLAESVTGKRDTVHLAVVGQATAISELMPRMKKSGVICGRITPEVEADLKKLGTQVVVRTESNVWWIRCGHACLGRGSSQAFGIRA